MFKNFGRTRPLLVLFLFLASTHAYSLHYHTGSLRYRSRRHSRVRVHHRHVVWAWRSPIRGSHDSLLRQNEEIDRLGLPRIADDEQLQELKQHQELVPILESRTLMVHPNLDPKNRFCRPWTRQFLQDAAAAYYRQFHQPIQVNSAVRTEEQQQRLRRWNHNAAPASGDTESSHVAGITVDISRHGMTRAQRKWMVQYLYDLREHGLIEAAEERREPVFHVMVSQRYESLHEPIGRESSQQSREPNQTTDQNALPANVPASANE